MLSLKAPLAGILVPLEHVPDPVFARKIVGDGVSIDPVEPVLKAPCDGTVIQLHSCGHALTLSPLPGLEIMMHIGIDTVHLKGEGFKPLVKAGETVKTGQPLIEFDADLVARRAASLLTQILVTTPDRVSEMKPATGSVKAGVDVVLELRLAEAGPAPAAGAAVPEKTITSEAVVIPNETGLHARPAAVLAGLVRRYKSEIRLHRGTASANARSLVAVMGLDVRRGDKVHLTAKGPDAEAALAALLPALRDGLGDGGGMPAPATPARTTEGPTRPTQEEGRRRPDGAAQPDPNLLTGVSASPGLAVGRIRKLLRTDLQIPETAETPEVERRNLAEALEQAKLQTGTLHDRLAATADAGKAAIFAAHQELMDDPDVLDLTESAIAKGKSAAAAWNAAITVQADRLAGMSNELLAARANDLRDVGRRVLRILLGVGEEKREFPPETILIAEDLTPSDTAALDRGKVLGFATVAGGATSHVAILARSLGLPAIAAIEPRVLDTPDDVPAILDGSAGHLRLNPASEEIGRVRNEQRAAEDRRRLDVAAAAEPAVTQDGSRIAVVANVGGQADAAESVRLGGEGVGLLRSEFLFLDRATPPTEEEQTEVYAAMAKALGSGRTLTIRTLDVGGDKPLSYLPLPREENPFLGVRGIRIGLDRPDLLRPQLRAILRASAAGAAAIQVMFPMITGIEEFREARAALEAEAKALGLPMIPAGIMIEVPSAALLADVFATEVDFFSVGTNDLTQYTLAMDRGHPKLASRVDGLHPAVLKLIGMTVQAAAARNKPVSVCGGLAGDSRAVPVLIGLGVDKLSVSVPAIPGIKALARRLSMAECRKMAAKALSLETPAAVRELVAASVTAA